jgi:RNA polymerase sigma-70 factor (ECF subfamily)
MPLTPRAATRSRASEQTPEELALRAQSGSLAAFSELVGRFEGRLFNFLLRRVGSAADAEDLTQDTFLRAWQRIGTYRPTWRFSTWLFTIATRLAVSSARRVSPRREPIRDDHGARAVPPALPDDGVARSRIWSMVSELLGPEQQTALWLRYVEDMAVKDIATVLGRTQVSVRVMLFRARAVLAPALEQEHAALDSARPPQVTIARPLQPGAR